MRARGPLQPRVGRSGVLRGIGWLGPSGAIPHSRSDRRTPRDWHRGRHRERRWVLTAACDPEAITSGPETARPSLVSLRRMPVRETPIPIREEQADVGSRFSEATRRQNAKTMAERELDSRLPRRHSWFASRVYFRRHAFIALPPNDLAVQRRRAAPSAASAG
jgi:hypothetical protein